jgi:RecJ-like exonuclease
MDFRPAIEKAKSAKKILIVSHYDCDGLCSAKILKDALEGEGKQLEILIAKEVTPEIIREALTKESDLIIFSDLGSGYLSLMPKDKEIIILDHHDPETEQVTENIIQINPCLEKKELCGSGVCYLFAESLNPENSRLIDWAVVGAIGDNQIEEGENLKVMKQAQKMGRLKVEKGLNIFGHVNRPLSQTLKNSNHIPFNDESEIVQFLSDLNIDLNHNGKIKSYCDLKDKEKELLKLEVFKEVIRRGDSDPAKVFSNIYLLPRNSKKLMDAREFSTILNAFGRLERYNEAFEMLGGDMDKLEAVMLEYRQKIASYLSWTARNLKKFASDDNALFIDAGDNIHENMIGTITSISINGIAKKGIVIGLANGEGGIKISARSENKNVDLNEILSSVCESLGGYGGGHAAAAGGKIPPGKSKEFIEAFQNALKTRRG